MRKGGVLGAFVMCSFAGGTRQRFDKEPEKGPNGGKAAKETVAAMKDKKKSPMSPMVYVKEPVAKFFGFTEMTGADMIRQTSKTYDLTINGQTKEVSSLANMGATGASRSVTVKFTALQTINKKQVASVKIAMPSSYTYRDMVRMLMETKQSGKIAAIVSPAGRSLTFKSPYNPKKIGAK
jgi:hypothetical protein